MSFQWMKSAAFPVRPGAGFNEKYGLLGSNYTNDNSVKLFPRECDIFVNELHKELEVRTGKDIEVLVYGDGAFKDPACGIWELADPVVISGLHRRTSWDAKRDQIQIRGR